MGTFTLILSPNSIGTEYESIMSGPYVREIPKLGISLTYGSQNGKLGLGMSLGDIVYILSTKSPQDVHRVSTGCPRGVHGVSTGCPRGVHGVSMGCPQGVHRMSTGCPQGVHN